MTRSPLSHSIPSLEGRIISRLTVTTLVAIILAYAFLWWDFQDTAGGLRARSMINAARQVAQGVTLDPQGNVRLTLPQAVLDGYRNSNGGHRFAVRDLSSNDILIEEGGAVGPVPGKLFEDEDGVLYQHDPDGPGPLTFFGEALPITVGSRSLVIQVERLGSNYEELMETMLADFIEDGGWATGPFLLILLGVSVMTIRRTLAPLRSLSQQAAAIGPTSTGLRLPRQDVPQEILPLVLAVNDALDRLDAGFRIQREFTADAAHELRTPLAILGASIDTLVPDDVACILRRDVDSMARLVEQLMRVAQMDNLVIADHEVVELNEVALRAAEWLAPLAIPAGRSLALNAADHPVMVRGNADAILNALRNLAENALRYTPRGQDVVLSVQADPPAISVRDFGSGVPENIRESIFWRFWRPERQEGGAGLGLAIVKRIMDVHGGQVTVTDAEGGGAVFTLLFRKS